MDKNTIISKSYNLAIEEGFNSYLEENATGENSEIKVDEEALVAQIEENWLNTGIAEIEDITPKEYIKSLVTLNQLTEFFITIATVSDVGVPDMVIERLKEHGKFAADVLFDFVQTSLNSKDPNRYQAVPEAVYAIGCMKCEDYKRKLIQLLIESCQDEMVSEAICAAIVEYDEEIVQDIIKAFHATDQELVREHLFTCIAEISKEHQSDEIFYFLKNAFRVIANLKLTVEVLGDYGDGRAIPLLRGFILKNIKDMDKTTFNHIRAIIKKLGGEINDLVY